MVADTNKQKRRWGVGLRRMAPHSPEIGWPLGLAVRLRWYLEERLGIAPRHPPIECLPDPTDELETLVRNNAVWKPVKGKNFKQHGDLEQRMIT